MWQVIEGDLSGELQDQRNPGRRDDQRFMGLVIGIKLENADADSYKYEPMAELIDLWETIKKDKHDEHCNNQQKHFSLFVL